MNYHIVCKTLTNAQRMARSLDKNGIRSSVKRLPSDLREQNGCGYAVRVDEKDVSRAVELLNEINLTPVRVYRSLENGGEEIRI